MSDLGLVKYALQKSFGFLASYFLENLAFGLHYALPLWNSASFSTLSSQIVPIGV